MVWYAILFYTGFIIIAVVQLCFFLIQLFYYIHTLISHGRFFKGTEEDANGDPIAGPRSWEWVRSGYMTKSAEDYLFAAQEQALNTRSIRSRIYHEVNEDGKIVSDKCRVCGTKVETVEHIAGGCSVLMEGPGDSKARQDGIKDPLGVMQEVWGGM